MNEMNYIDAFKKILDPQDVTVGGGSAAALSGAMGAGLIGMAALLSVGKNCGWADKDYLAAESRCSILRQRLLIGAVNDAEAYGQIVSAYKLPKADEREKVVRQAAIEAAGLAAASVPRDNAVGCREIFDVGMQLREKSNRSAASDLMYGLELARLGVLGCVANIEANLPLIKSAGLSNQFAKIIKKLTEGVYDEKTAGGGQHQ